MSDKQTPEGTQKAGDKAGGTETPPDTSKAGSGAPGASQTPPAEMFPRSYVEELRKESGGYRDKAKRVDLLAQRLVTAYAATTSRLADPTDLLYDDALLGEDGMPDQAKVTAAVEELVKLKPHLASRRPPVADVGQGVRDETSEAVTFGGLLRDAVA